MSPTYSQTVDLEMCTIIQEFEIDKKSLKEKFYLEKNKEKRQKFFKSYSKDQRDKL